MLKIIIAALFIVGCGSDKSLPKCNQDEVLTHSLDDYYCAPTDEAIKRWQVTDKTPPVSAPSLDLSKKTWVCTHTDDESTTASICAPSQVAAFAESSKSLCADGNLQACSKDIVCVLDHGGC